MGFKRCKGRRELRLGFDLADCEAQTAGRLVAIALGEIEGPAGEVEGALGLGKILLGLDEVIGEAVGIEIVALDDLGQLGLHVSLRCDLEDPELPPQLDFFDQNRVEFIAETISVGDQLVVKLQLLLGLAQGVAGRLELLALSSRFSLAFSTEASDFEILEGGERASGGFQLVVDSAARTDGSAPSIWASRPFNPPRTSGGHIDPPMRAIT